MAPPIDPAKYAALATMIELRGAKLVNRLTGRTIAVYKDGHCNFKMPDGSTIEFRAKRMREVLAGMVRAEGGQPDLARYQRIRHLFRMERDVLVSVRTGRAPAVRKDGQCRIEVEGKALCFSPEVMRATFVDREAAIEAWRRSIDTRKQARTSRRVGGD